MREIKFRAWSEPLKLMQFFELVNDNGMLGKNGEIHRENYKIMQYTGLLDKNGKEIYEGDIVQYESNFNPKTKSKPKVIVWQSFLGGIGFNITPPRSRNGGDINNTCTVIGNIYENEDLLK